LSFYSSIQNIRPGRINGDANIGLRNRVAISVERILDGSLKKITADNTQLVLSNIVPQNPSPPFTFVNAVSSASECIISNLTINRLEERTDLARIECKITVPVKVTFTDANGTTVTADSQIVTPIDVIMFVPSASVFPFEVKASASCNCPTGVPTGTNGFTVTSHMTLVIKITAQSDLLMATYGFCPIPVAVDFESETRNEFFDLPLYPSSR
jgi:hypothetical protein